MQAHTVGHEGLLREKCGYRRYRSPCVRAEPHERNCPGDQGHITLAQLDLGSFTYLSGGWATPDPAGIGSDPRTGMTPRVARAASDGEGEVVDDLFAELG